MDNINKEENTLNDVIVCMTGEARGHEFFINEKFITDLKDVGNKVTSVKCRINHPAEKGNVLSIIGEASDFYIDKCFDKEDNEQTCVKAKKLKVYNLPDNKGKTIIALAEQAPDHFGLSIDAGIKLTDKKILGLPIAKFKELHAIDFVDCPAAAPSLFSAIIDEPGHIMLSVNSKKVVKESNDKENDLILKESNMAKNTTKLEEVKDEPKKDEVKETTTLEALAARLDEMVKKMESYEAKMEEEEKKEVKEEPKKDEIKAKEEEEDKKEDKKDKVKETLEETIKNTVTREFTSLLAKNGGRVTLEEKQAPVENVDAPNLTAEQIQLAEKYGVDKVQYAKDLANERKRTQI